MDYYPLNIRKKKVKINIMRKEAIFKNFDQYVLDHIKNTIKKLNYTTITLDTLPYSAPQKVLYPS